MNILEIRSPFGKEQAAVKMIYLNGVRLFWLIFLRTDDTISAVGSISSNLTYFRTLNLVIQS